MGNCCNPAGYERFFDAGEARRDARRYRSKGLAPTARRIVDVLAAGELSGATVLEVGGGVGDIQIELLHAGAERTLNVELSSGYEQEAQALLAERGLTDRVERRVADFVAVAGELEPAEIVVMHRVVCCYPAMDALVSAAARTARRRLAMTYPRRRWFIRAALRAGNAWFALRRIDFRAYVHPPDDILAVARRMGFEPVFEHRGRIWQTLVLERQAS